jgi:cytochrome c oxidase cbb3-type subunit 3
MNTLRSTILILSTTVACSILFFQCTKPISHPADTVLSKDSVATKDSAASPLQEVHPAKLSYEQRQGKTLYTKYCTICHGDQGKGDGFNAYNLDPKPRDFTDPRAMAGIDDATMLAVITGGGKAVNKSPLMPAWGRRMNKLEIEYVIEYIKALEGKH